MNDRIASLVSSLVVALLALAITGHVYLSRDVDRRGPPTLGPVDGSGSCAPATAPSAETECVA